MTITLELTPEQERRIKADAKAAGLEPAAYLLRFIDVPKAEESATERLARIGVLGAVSGKRRAAGRAWSEIEGYEFDRRSLTPAQ